MEKYNIVSYCPSEDLKYISEWLQTFVLAVVHMIHLAELKCYSQENIQQGLPVFSVCENAA